MPYKYCVVPKCYNTTKKTPEKLFFMVPYEPKVRKKWMNVMKRADPVGPKSCAFCCEDHFDVENDMENYVKYKLVGGQLKLKKGVLPHKFSCQKQLDEKSERSAVEKRKKVEIINKVMSENFSGDVESTSHDIEDIYIVDSAEVEEDPLEDATVNYSLEGTSDKIIKKKHKNIQVVIKNKVHHKGTITDDKLFNVPATKNKIRKTVKKQEAQQMNTSFEETSSLTSVSYNNECDTGSDVTCTEAEFEKISFKMYMQKASLLCISREPQLLLGLPKECYFCIQLLSESCKCTPRDVMIVLKKIRLYHSNAILALDFGISSSHLGFIFRKKLPLIASCMASLVFFPKPNEVLANLPMPFRKRYSNVQSIIDCLEIQIAKPSNAIHQALTWSEYKSCNTIKYLISITPDGLINFISEGYGGRTSDSQIFEDCGILNKLPKNKAVMADRGFKNVAHLLQQHECTLIRPPSVSAKVTPTKSEVLETKKIAALRIHVERSIGRLRNFALLAPHATVDLKQVDLLDCIVSTACGIVNLQNPLFDVTS